SLSEFFRAAHRSPRRPHSRASIESANFHAPLLRWSARAVSPSLPPPVATASAVAEARLLREFQARWMARLAPQVERSARAVHWPVARRSFPPPSFLYLSPRSAVW